MRVSAVSIYLIELKVGHLQWSHRDPWDRLLAAPALPKNCVPVSADKVSGRAGVPSTLLAG